MPDLTTQLKERAQTIGFQLAGVCPAVAPAGFARFGQWLEAGYAGEMHYLANRAHAYEHPRHVMDGVRSLVILAMNYRTEDAEKPGPDQGRVSRYAWGPDDYHEVIRARLGELAEWLCSCVPNARVRGVVDTAPLLEREFAQLAGLGWVGKNTLLLNKALGSWFFLAALLTDLTLDYDQPHESDHCGTCRACLDACPTDAFPQPYVLDATRCISYLTIEHKESIPEPLRETMGDWVFGCDICQEVCPWNHHAPVSNEPSFAPLENMNPVDLPALFDLDDATFRRLFRSTPLWRPKRRGLLRNAAIALGNRPQPQTVPALEKGLNDHESLVRIASAWSLGRHDSPQAAKALRARLRIEAVPPVRLAIQEALSS